MAKGIKINVPMQGAEIAKVNEFTEAGASKTITDATKTADNVLTTFSDPRKIFGFLFLLAVVIVVFYVLRAPLKKAWELLKEPFARLKSDADAKQLQSTTRINTPNMVADPPGFAESPDVQLTDDDARNVAEAIANCWGGFWDGDNEDILFAQLSHIPGPVSFSKVDSYYRGLKIPYHDGLFWRTITTTDIATDILNNIGGSDLNRVRSILAARHISLPALKSTQTQQSQALQFLNI